MVDSEIYVVDINMKLEMLGGNNLFYYGYMIGIIFWLFLNMLFFFMLM